MGLADREYYQEHIRTLEREAETRTGRFGSPPRPPVGVSVGHPPDLPGANWPAWGKALVWLGIVALLFVSFKLIEMRGQVKKLEAEKRAMVETEKRRAEAERRAKPLPKIDFFK